MFTAYLHGVKSINQTVTMKLQSLLLIVPVHFTRYALCFMCVISTAKGSLKCVYTAIKSLSNKTDTCPRAKHLAYLCIIFGLTACANKPALESEAVINLNSNLAQLQQWKIKGRIAWISLDERKSAYMNWQQDIDSMQFDLSNVLGINLASLTYDGQKATLQADGKTFENASPSALIYQVSGWEVPLEQLSNWVKGAASQHGRVVGNAQASFMKQDDTQIVQQITRYENGLIEKIQTVCPPRPVQFFRCDEWTISYNRYANVIIDENEYQLPTSITLFNARNQATIKMRINEWSR